MASLPVKQQVAAWVKADIDGDGQANLDLINENIENHQHLLDDEDWV